MSILGDVQLSSAAPQALPRATLPAAVSQRRWSAVTQVPVYNPPVGLVVDGPATFDDLDRLVAAAAALPEVPADTSWAARDEERAEVARSMEAPQAEVLESRED